MCSWLLCSASMKQVVYMASVHALHTFWQCKSNKLQHVHSGVSEWVLYCLFELWRDLSSLWNPNRDVRKSDKMFSAFFLWICFSSEKVLRAWVQPFKCRKIIGLQDLFLWMRMEWAVERKKLKEVKNSDGRIVLLIWNGAQAVYIMTIKDPDIWNIWTLVKYLLV